MILTGLVDIALFQLSLELVINKTRIMSDFDRIPEFFLRAACHALSTVEIPPHVLNAVLDRK